jgi:hypothetical protein
VLKDIPTWVYFVAGITLASALYLGLCIFIHARTKPISGKADELTDENSNHYKIFNLGPNIIGIATILHCSIYIYWFKTIGGIWESFLHAAVGLFWWTAASGYKMLIERKKRNFFLQEEERLRKKSNKDLSGHFSKSTVNDDVIIAEVKCIKSQIDEKFPEIATYINDKLDDVLNNIQERLSARTIGE